MKNKIWKEMKVLGIRIRVKLLVDSLWILFYQILLETHLQSKHEINLNLLIRLFIGIFNFCFNPNQVLPKVVPMYIFPSDIMIVDNSDCFICEEQIHLVYKDGQ